MSSVEKVARDRADFNGVYRTERYSFDKFNQQISPPDMWATAKLIESPCDRLPLNDVCADGRRLLLYPAENVNTPASAFANRFQSTSNNSSSSSVGVSARFEHRVQHLLLPAVPGHHHHHHHHHHHQQQQQQQQQVSEVEAINAAGRCRLALWQALGGAAFNAVWSAWPLPQTPAPAPLQVLALYHAHFWMRLVSSLMAADLTAASTDDRQPFDRPQRPVVPSGGQYTVADQPSTSSGSSSTYVALTDGGPASSRINPVNWLLDPATSASTAAILGGTTSASGFDTARRLLEQLGEHHHYWTAGNTGGIDNHEEEHVRVRSGGACGRAGTATEVGGGGGFLCGLCLKRYATPGAMKMHSRTHTLPCRCVVCGKAFSRPWLLQGHLRTHTGERPFTCPLCRRAFADRSNLRAHLQTHVAVKKFACSRCDRTFSRMSLLLKHTRGNRTTCPPRTSATILTEHTVHDVNE